MTSASAALMTVPELRDELTRRGLSAAGKKSELVSRLEAALPEPGEALRRAELLAATKHAELEALAADRDRLKGALAQAKEAKEEAEEQLEATAVVSRRDPRQRPLQPDPVVYSDLENDPPANHYTIITQDAVVRVM